MELGTKWICVKGKDFKHNADQEYIVILNIEFENKESKKKILGRLCGEAINPAFIDSVNFISPWLYLLTLL